MLPLEGKETFIKSLSFVYLSRNRYLVENEGQFFSLRHGLMLLLFKDLMNATEQLQFIGSMNCNFSVAFIKSLNQSNIKSCLIVHLVAM